LQYGDTLSEYRSLTIKKYSINHAQNLTHLQLSAIPSYCRISDYTAAKKIDLLPEKSSAPLWTSVSPDGNAISLSNFKGKLILVDFFYKSCYACMKATPELELLYKKYKDQGLQVIGIDPVDSLNDETRHFITKAGIAYPVAIDEKRELPLKYHVTGYPTIYLISKEQKVIFAIDGYDKSVEEKLEDLIKANL
jgi:peroxiredoxin